MTEDLEQTKFNCSEKKSGPHYIAATWRGALQCIQSNKPFSPIQSNKPFSPSIQAASIMTTDDEEHRRTTAPIRHLHHLSVFLLLFSTAFWIWAFINNLRYDYVDGGVISFATVMLSSMFVLCVIHHGGHGRGFRSDHDDIDMGSVVDDEESSQDDTNMRASRNEPNALEAIQGSSQCKRRTIFIVPISSSLLVTLNYALGSVLTEHLWGKVYCGIFTGIWFILALVQFILTRRVFRIAGSAAI